MSFIVIDAYFCLLLPYSFRNGCLLWKHIIIFLHNPGCPHDWKWHGRRQTNTVSLFTSVSIIWRSLCFRHNSMRLFVRHAWQYSSQASKASISTWVHKCYIIHSTLLLFLSWENPSLFLFISDGTSSTASNVLLSFPMSNKSYNKPVTVVSKNLVERVQHLQLYKWEIHFPTTKGLCEGDITRIKQWFDIEIAQWKVRMLWLGLWRAMYFCLTLQWPKFNSQLIRRSIQLYMVSIVIKCFFLIYNQFYLLNLFQIITSINQSRPSLLINSCINTVLH